MTYPKEIESLATIRFQDCDPFGHLNNARYIDYFMNARVDQVRDAYDINLMDTSSGFNWVVMQTQIAYLSPAQFGATVAIQTRLLVATRRTVLVEAVMLDATHRQQHAVGWIQFMCVNVKTGRPALHDDSYQQIFDAVQISANPNDWNFEKRVHELRQRNKLEKSA